MLSWEKNCRTWQACAWPGDHSNTIWLIGVPISRVSDERSVWASKRHLVLLHNFDRGKPVPIFLYAHRAVSTVRLIYRSRSSCFDVFGEKGFFSLQVCTLQKPSRHIKVDDIDVPEQAPGELVTLIEACRAEKPEDRPQIAQICEYLDQIA